MIECQKGDLYDYQIQPSYFSAEFYIPRLFCNCHFILLKPFPLPKPFVKV